MAPAETPYLRPPGYPEHYRHRRFRTGTGRRTHLRELRALRWLLARIPGGPPSGPWLDLPGGTGRMARHLPGPAVLVDRNRDMLAEADGDHPRICASGTRLPFPAATFAGALCLRLMQHLPRAEERIATLTELRRVCSGPVVVSFFDAVTLQHLRRVVSRSLGKPRSGRGAISWRRFRSELRRAGLAPALRTGLLPGVSEQALVLALPR